MLWSGKFEVWMNCSSCVIYGSSFHSWCRRGAIWYMKYYIILPMRNIYTPYYKYMAKSGVRMRLPQHHVYWRAIFPKAIDHNHEISTAQRYHRQLWYHLSSIETFKQGSPGIVYILLMYMPTTRFRVHDTGVSLLRSGYSRIWSRFASGFIRSVPCAQQRRSDRAIFRLKGRAESVGTCPCIRPPSSWILHLSITVAQSP